MTRAVVRDEALLDNTRTNERKEEIDKVVGSAVYLNTVEAYPAGGR